MPSCERTHFNLSYSVRFEVRYPLLSYKNSDWLFKLIFLDINFQSDPEGKLSHGGPYGLLALHFLVTCQLAPLRATRPIVNFSLAAHFFPGLAAGNLIPGYSQKISGNGVLETHLSNENR